MIECEGNAFRRSDDALSTVAPDRSCGEFPIRDDISSGESGHGYVLRMAAANYLGGLPTVKKMLGKTRFAVLEGVDATSIAGWFGADPKKLELALGATGIGRLESEFELCGHPIGRSYFVNRMHPRVCSLCLAQAPYCLSHWDLTLVTACHFHGVSLEEKCRWCGDNLSWNRPSVTMCKCGGDLVSTQKAYACTTLERDLSQWVAEKLIHLTDVHASGLSTQFGCASLESPLMRLLQPLTLDGGLKMIYALGTAERCDASASHALQRKKTSIASARDVLLQAETMMGKLIAVDHVDFRKSSLSVIVNLLAESTKANSDAVDRSLALSLIYVLLRRGGRSNWKSRYPQLSQYELF